MFKWLSLKFIKLYQLTISPDHGLFRRRYPNGFCRFYPTCSEYIYQVVEKYGFLRGWYLGIKRVLRCNPFNPGGYDPIR